MHTPRCMPSRAVLGTIVLPRRKEQRFVTGTGADVDPGLQLPAGAGLVVCGGGLVRLTLEINGGGEHVVTFDATTPQRIVSPESYTGVRVNAAASVEIQLWIEDLAALRGGED